MNTTEYIESGILELYVYGLLTLEENKMVAEIAREHSDVRDEIVAIEKSMISFSGGFSPSLPSSKHDEIRSKIIGKQKDDRPVKTRTSYFGWAAALVFLLLAGYFYYELNLANMDYLAIENKQKEVDEISRIMQAQKMKSDSALAILRDRNNSIVDLAGQGPNVNATATIYINRESQLVYIDASRLPEPPKDMVYQVWGLQYEPLRPTSIGVLDSFSNNYSRLFLVETFGEAQGFAVTLEPSGGSQQPTMGRLFVMGAI